MEEMQRQLTICCFGGSFGAGILAKTMCVAPEKIEKAVLYIPSGIKNAPAINSMSMMIPMIMYWITQEDKWLRKCILPMVIKEENITLFKIEYIIQKEGLSTPNLPT